MEQPTSTVNNSNKCKLWHAFNYFVGGGTFLVGSIMLFPIFTNYMDAAQISGWLYTIGSATFLLADITEWLHYVYKDCRFKIYAINFFVSAFGSLLYLIGSVCFIPEVGQFDFGMTLFIWGSALIIVSQTWKLIRGLNKKKKAVNPSGFWVDLFADFGGLMYFSGTFVFRQAADNPDLTDYAALIYSIGGFFFFSWALFMNKRYFWQQSNIQIYHSTENSIVASEV